MDAITNQDTGLPVYLGAWINWSKGPVYGATLTLTRRNGNLLIAFAAFFVTWVGTSLWRIACLLFHVSYSSSEQLDALYHQRQAVLRNTYSAVDGLLVLVKLLYAWRRRANKPYWRVLPLLVFAAVCVVGFALASGFSSTISSSMGSEVLLSGADCGNLNFPDLPDLSSSLRALLTEYYPYKSKTMSSAAAYAQECYGTSMTSNNLNCGTFIRKQLSTMTIRNATCPFPSNICQSNDSNLFLDSNIDSLYDLGLNTPSNARFTYRHRIHCAPLRTDGYKTNFNVSESHSTSRYFYGRTTIPSTLNNHTYQYTNDAHTDRVKGNETSPTPDYSLTARGAFMPPNGPLKEEESEFEPIPGLRSDGYVNLVFLSGNDISFVVPVSDPWYHANVPYTIKASRSSGSAINTTTYRLDEAASPLGCLEFEQICNPNAPQGSQCSELSGGIDLIEAAKSLFEGEALETFIWALRGPIYNYPPIGELVETLGTHILTSRHNLHSGFQGPLPNDQWQLDVMHWHNMALAALQANFVNTVIGASRAQAPTWTNGPNSTVERRLCESQKIISADYTSVSILGLAILFGLGGLIILLSLSLESILSCCLPFRRSKHSPTRSRQRKSYSLMEWSTNETLQLQRLAHEEAGLGTWSRTTSRIPVTLPGELIANLDLSREDHPRLVLVKEGSMTESSGGSERETKLEVVEEKKVEVVEHRHSRPIAVESQKEADEVKRVDETPR